MKIVQQLLYMAQVFIYFAVGGSFAFKAHVEPLNFPVFPDDHSETCKTL